MDLMNILPIVISIIALLMPLWQYLYKKLFLSLKLKIKPFNGINLLFNESGSYLKLRFALICKNREITVNKVWVEVSNKMPAKTETMSFDWQFLDPVVMNWVGPSMANSLNTTSYARPIKIAANSVEPLLIEMSNNNINQINELSAICSKRNTAIQNIVESTRDADNKFILSDIVTALRGQEIYTELVKNYSKFLFWKSGEYSLSIHLNYNDNKEYKQTFSFSLTEEESMRIENNIDTTIFCRLYQQYGSDFRFDSIHKELVEVTKEAK